MRKFIVVSALCALCSCAGIRHQSAASDSGNSEPKGFRYYEPAWFILAYVNGEGQVITKHMILPDTTKPMSIMPFADLAKNTATLEFKNGMLVSSTSNIEATEATLAVIEAAKQVVKAYLTPVPSVADTKADEVTEPVRETLATVRGPYLYKLVHDDEHWSKLIGDGGDVLHLPIARASGSTKMNGNSESPTENKSSPGGSNG